MGNRKVRNVRNLGNLRKIIPSFLTSEFSILPYSQSRKLRLKNLGKKFPRFPRFLSFRPGRSIRGHKGQNSTETRCRGFLVLEYRCRGFSSSEKMPWNHDAVA